MTGRRRPVRTGRTGRTGRRRDHPPFLEAVLADAHRTAAFRIERHDFASRTDAYLQVARLAWDSDAFLAQVCYRAKARLQALGVPLLPRLAHLAAVVLAQVNIGDDVLVHPGLYLAHGQVLVQGPAELHPGVVLFPWVTITGDHRDGAGPVLEPDVRVGTGAIITGAVVIGASVRVGANAVVDTDVPPGAVVTGVPDDRPVGTGSAIGADL